VGDPEKYAGSAVVHDRDPNNQIALVLRLLALQRRVSQLNGQLDCVEAEMHRLLNEANRDRFEDYR
jgi:hypothetical protein